MTARLSPANKEASLPLTLDAIERQSARSGEPMWLASWRRESLMRFAERPPLDTRYTRLRLDWRSLSPAAPRFVTGSAPCEGLEPLADDLTSTFAQPMSRFAPAAGPSLRDEMKPSTQWDPLVCAAWREGLALSWPAGAETERVPFIGVEGGEGIVPEPYLLNIGAGAKADLFMSWKRGDGGCLRLSSISGRVGKGARLRLALLHDGASEHHHISLNLDIAQDASVELFCAWLGGRWTVHRGTAEMAAPGSSWKETHMVWGDGRDHFDADSQVRHLASRTASDVRVKAALAGRSRSVFTGNVLMEKEASQADGYLSDHVLLLSKEARSDSVPGFEIRAMDVKAAHAASTSQVDEEQMFYVQSRGLNESEARHLLVKGFLESLMERAPFPFLEGLVDPMLEGRVAT